MSNWSNKRKFIRDKAISLNGSTMTAMDLAQELNKFGFLTDYGTTYSIQPGRGIYKAIAAAYSYAQKHYGQHDANIIADAFVKANNQPAWKP